MERGITAGKLDVSNPHACIMPPSFPFASRTVLSLTACRTVTLAVALVLPCMQASAMTLYKCRIEGRIVYSDTDCPRMVRIKKSSAGAAKPATPRIVRITRKTSAKDKAKNKA